MTKSWLVERFFAQIGSRQVFIVRQEFLNPAGRNLHVIFLPWHAGEVPYKWLCHRLTRRGDAVVVYYFAEEVLTPDVGMVKWVYQQLQTIITSSLTKITNKTPYRSVNFIGMSLGNVALAVVADRFNKFDRVTMVCTASSLAKSVWYGDRTKDVRAELEANQLSLAQVEKVWYEVEPINHVAAFSDKKVTIIVSKTDSCIPTRFQTELVQAARKSITDLCVKYTKLGHYGAIINYCLFGKTKYKKDKK
jgi:hypothetical protein